MRGSFGIVGKFKSIKRLFNNRVVRKKLLFYLPLLDRLLFLRKIGQCALHHDYYNESFFFFCSVLKYLSIKDGDNDDGDRNSSK